jgi:hypothetical protein
MTSPLSVTARRLANGPWGRRYARHLAAECDESLVDAAAALEVSLFLLLSRVSAPPASLLPRLTAAWMSLLYKGEPRPPNPTERRLRESKAIRAFAKRVYERREARFGEALTGELLDHFFRETG